MNALEIYGALGGRTDAATRDRAAAVLDIVRIVDAAPPNRRTETMKDVARARGLSFGTVRRHYYELRKRGAESLVDGRRARRGAVRLPTWLEVYRTYAENDRNTSIGGWRRMMAEFQAGRDMPCGIGTWRDVWARENPAARIPDAYPVGWIPQGATYQNLQKAAKRDPDYVFQTLAARQGMRAAHAALLPVLTTRRGLPVGAIYQFDDVWHNIDIMLPNGRTAQPLEFAGYDVASAYKCASCMKPRFTREDGTRCNLTEQQFRFLLGYTMCVTGFHKGGVRLVLEHGTTAIRSEVDRQIRAIPGFGDLITHAESGILSEQVHAGLFAGIGGGNFRFKGLVETSHNILHDREAFLPGNRGRDAAHLHESQAALVRYEERLVQAVAKIDPCAVARIESGLLSWAQYAEAFAQLENILMHDPVHRLEGWDGREVAEYRMGQDGDWHDAEELLDMGDADRAAIVAYLSAHPENKRRRYMSRAEVWSAGQKDFVHVPLFEMPAFLSDKDVLMLEVRRNGLIGIRDALYYGRDEMVYRAEAADIDGTVRRFAPGEKLAVKYNPMVPDSVWIVDKESGATLGMAPLYNRAPVYDRHAIEVAMGEQSADLARKVLPVRGRHQADAERRAARIAANANLLAELRSAPASPASSEDAADAPDTMDELVGTASEAQVPDLDDFLP